LLEQAVPVQDVPLVQVLHILAGCVPVLVIRELLEAVLAHLRIVEAYIIDIIADSIILSNYVLFCVLDVF
jgi:hypothetical protein